MHQLIYGLIFAAYMAGKQLYFNFDADINTPPFRLRIHNKTLQALAADMLVVAGLGCLADPGGLWICVIGICLDVLMLADLLYMRYYKNPLSVSVILHNIRVMKEARESVADVLKKKDLLYLADIPLFALAALHLSSNPVPFWQRFLYAVLLTVAGCVWLLVVYHKSNRAPYLWNRKRIARDLGILFFHCSDVKRYVLERLRKRTYLTEDEAIRAAAAFCPVQENAFSGLGKGKNLIIVQMEAMQDFLVGMEVCGQEVTPNLNRLMAENLRLKNMFFQTSVANTSDAEVLSNNALFPLLDKPACYELQDNTFYSLGTRMREKNYCAMAFHGNQASTWNRYLVYRQYGYERFVDNTTLKNDEVVYLGLSDPSFYRQSMELLCHKCGSEPFFAFLISLSQHHPYRQFSDFPFPVGEFEGSMFGNYLKGAHYADQAIGLFIDDLKRRGLYDTSILLMYGDHSGIPELYYSGGQLKEKDTGKMDLRWLEAQKVAALLHIPGLEHMATGYKPGDILDKVVGQVDVLPTLCNLFGLDGRFLLGEDILDNRREGAVILRDGTVITKDFSHFNQQDVVWHWDTHKQATMSEAQRILVQRMEERLSVSDLLMEHDGVRWMMEHNQQKNC